MAITTLDTSYCTYKFLVDTDLGSSTVQNSSTPSFLKLYDSVPDGGIVAASTEPDYILQIDGGKNITFNFPSGLSVVNGLSMRCVASGQTNDTSDPGSNVTVTVVYS